MLKKAKLGKYAVGAFNFKEYSDMKAIAAAAAEQNAPVILMSSAASAKFFGIKEVVYTYRGICEDLPVPCALHLDHAKDPDLIRQCVDAGYTSVMIDASTMPFDKNIETTKRVVDMARNKGVSVEAELGTIEGREDDVVGGAAEFVDPEKVREFVEQTSVDALAIAIGTVHGFYKKTPQLRFDLIEAAAKLTGAPLVMHGGSGLTAYDFKKAIECGISKVNVGTELKHAFSCSLCETASKDNAASIDPMEFMRPVREACKKIAAEKIMIFGSAGRA